MYVMLFMLCIKESRRLFVDPVIELPLIGNLCQRRELWDRVGANVSSRWKQIYCEKLFRGTKKKTILEGDSRLFVFVLLQFLGNVDTW